MASSTAASLIELVREEIARSARATDGRDGAGATIKSGLCAELRKAAHPAEMGYTRAFVQHVGDAPPMANETIVSFANPAFHGELSDLAREGAQRRFAREVLIRSRLRRG